MPRVWRFMIVIGIGGDHGTEASLAGGSSYLVIELILATLFYVH